MEKVEDEDRSTGSSSWIPCFWRLDIYISTVGMAKHQIINLTAQKMVI